MNKPLRVLVVEDSQDDATFVLRELKRGGFDPMSARVESLGEFSSALDERGWDVVISDHTMPGFGSLQALDLLQKKQLDIPFIVVSGTIGEEVAVKTMKAGAHDYVMKSNLARLVPSIERELRDAWSRRTKRRAEEALRRSEEELNDFFEHASVGLQWLGPDGIILRVNQTELRMLGYAHEEYAGHVIHEFHVDKDRADDLLERLHAGEELSDYEARLRGKNGAIREVLITANVLREHGHFVHARCFTRDITDRKAGEQARAHLAAIVESSDDAIIGTTLDGAIVSWNASARRMYGYSAREVTGSPMTLLAPASRPGEWPEVCVRIKRGETVTRFETMRLRKDGTTLEVAVTYSPIKNEAGTVVGISAVERDITVDKREEAERLQLITELTNALGKIKTLHGLLPICASCKKIREDGGYWKKIETYISERTEAEFTHGICPDCLSQLYPQYLLRNEQTTGQEKLLN
jgi:PAS domain S-box-containing protein